MNYLAHAYLSFHHPDILLGNMISDFVKGKKQFAYPPAVQKGIRLHRSIDQFTDNHAATSMVKDIFRKAYGRYGGALADIIYDHFLAHDPSIFPGAALVDFTQRVYADLDQLQDMMPPGFAQLYPHMKETNWLYHYREKYGIERSFKGLVRRAAYLTESETAFRLFEENYRSLQSCYTAFFPELLQHARAEFEGGIISSAPSITY